MTTDLVEAEVESRTEQASRPDPAGQPSPARQPVRRKKKLFSRRNKASVDEIWARTQAAAAHPEAGNPASAGNPDAGHPDQDGHGGEDEAELAGQRTNPTKRTSTDPAADDQHASADGARQGADPAPEPSALGPSGWVRSAIPILIVNAVSMWGQASYGHDHLVPSGLDFPDSARWGIGVTGALAAEVVALYVNWHAHDALLRRDHLTAGRLRRAAYAIALLVATVNYTHFATDGWKPVPLAVVMAMFTVLSPWLWGLHTRRRQHMQLQAAGVRADAAGAVFAPARIWWFPIRSMMARRWSIDHGVTDPIEAWEGYRKYRATTGRLSYSRGATPTPRPRPVSITPSQDSGGDSDASTKSLTPSYVGRTDTAASSENSATSTALNSGSTSGAHPKITESKITGSGFTGPWFTDQTTDSGNADSGHIDSGHADSGQADSVRPHSVRTDSLSTTTRDLLAQSSPKDRVIYALMMKDDDIPEARRWLAELGYPTSADFAAQVLRDREETAIHTL